MPIKGMKSHTSLMHEFQTLRTCSLLIQHLLYLIQLEFTSVALTSTFLTTDGVSYDITDVPRRQGNNLSELVFSVTATTSEIPESNISTNSAFAKNMKKMLVERTVSDGSDVPRDSPTALVIASSIAAVSIIVFFIIAYLWHTHQLDSRARKLAIRLAADAESGMRCRSSRSQISQKYHKATPKEKSRTIPQASLEQAQYMALTADEDRGHSSEGGHSSVGVSESESGDNDDLFEQTKFPPIAGDRGKGGAKNGRGSNRKYNRTRKSYSGANLDKRHSTVTDKDILSHFASRRHSTFFI